MAVAPTQVDSGRFSVLDDDLSDTDVDEGGVEALSPFAVDESSNLEREPSEVIAMPAPFGVGVSIGGRTHTDGFAVSCQWESHAPSEVESDVECHPVLNPDNIHNEHSFVEEDMLIVDFIFGAAARATLQGFGQR